MNVPFLEQENNSEQSNISVNQIWQNLTEFSYRGKHEQSILQ